MYSDFDTRAKAILKANDSLEVPLKVSEGIDNTLKTIKNKNSNRFSRKASLAAALVIATIIGLTAAFPAIAENIPLINRLIGDNTLAINHTKIENYSEIENLKAVMGTAPVINKSAGNITLTKLAYDGIAFYSVYEISNTAYDDSFKYSSSIFVGNTEYMGQFFFTEMVDDTTARVIQVYPIPYGSPPFPEDTVVILQITKNNSFYNQFRIDLSSSEELHYLYSSKKELNNEILLGSSKGKLVSLIQSQAYVSLVVEFDNYQPADRFVLFDSNGIELRRVDMGGIIEKDTKTLVTFLFEPTENFNVERIKVIEEQNKILSPATVRNKQLLDLSSQLPAKITIGEDKAITVLGVVEDDVTYKVILQTRDIAINSFARIGGLALYDQEKSKNINSSYYCGRAISIGDNQYMMIFYKNSGFNFNNVALSFGNYDHLIKVLYDLTIR